MTQSELFSSVGEELKAEGIQRVSEHNEQWVARAVQEIMVQLVGKMTITADDIRYMDKPNHPNATGAAFNSAARLGIIERVGYAKSTHPSTHGRVVSVWRRKG